jgi:hypothetical protein
MNGPHTGPALLRQIGPGGVARVTQPRAPTALHAQTTSPKVTKTKTTTSKAKKNSGGSSSSTHHSLTEAEVVQVVLNALQGDPLRLAVEDIARQVYWQLQAQQSSALIQGGSYQRQGGF